MFTIQCIRLYDLNDEDSENFDKNNLHDPAFDKYWYDWVSDLHSYEAVCLELIRALNADELDLASGFVRIVKNTYES